jgi:hypothetical protein
VEKRLGRVARNEAVFRSVNREIEQASREVGDADLEILCECGRDDCRELIQVTVSEYDKSHEQEDRFIVLPGHETTSIERVAERTDRYLVVDKFGEAEEIVERSG